MTKPGRRYGGKPRPLCELFKLEGTEKRAKDLRNSAEKNSSASKKRRLLRFINR